MRKFFFYLLKPVLRFNRYPDTSHGWNGVWCLGRIPLAFEDVEGLRFFSF